MNKINVAVIGLGGKWEMSERLYPCYKNRLFLELNLRFTQNEELYPSVTLKIYQNVFKVTRLFF